jgi:hypothetical protein
MTNDQLIAITREVDEILASLSNKHQIAPLSLAAVFNARLIWACRETGCEDDFHKLLSTIQTKQYDTVKPTFTH